MSERDMQDLLDLVQRHLGKQWIDIAEWLREQNSLDELEAKIRAGNYRNAVEAIDDAALRWAAETQGQYVHAAQTASKWLDEQPALKDSLIRFDAESREVVARAQQNQLEYVYGFRDEQNQIARQITQQSLVTGATSGENPRVIAQRFRDSIGLAPNHEQWLASYRQSLEQGDYTAALQRELSSGHSDRSIAAARDADRTLTQQQIDQAVDRYRDNLLTYRAENIARTESGRNVHEGVADAYKQAIKRGDLDADQLEKEWMHGPVTQHSRHWHVELDGKRVPFADPFILGNGTRMQYPHDPAGGADENASCTCTYATTLQA